MDLMELPKKINFHYETFLFSEELHDVLFEFEDEADNMIHVVQAGVVDDMCNIQTDRKVQTIPAHSQILAFSSEVFRTQLFGVLQERTIKIKDVSVDTFRTFLRCIYTGELQVTTENMFELAYVANNCPSSISVGLDIILAYRYMISKITQMIVEFFKHQFDRVDMFWKLFNPEQLPLFDDEKSSLLNMLLTRFERNPSMYLNSVEFMYLREETVAQLVRCDPLSIKEVDLYQAVARWAEYQCARNDVSATAVNMRSHVKGFVHNLRMPTLTNAELVYTDGGGIHTNDLLLPEEKVNLAAYCSGLTSIDIPFLKIPRRKSRDVIVCTAERVHHFELDRRTSATILFPGVNIRFVGVTYVLDVQAVGELPERLTTEIRSSRYYSKRSEYYDLLCSFEWIASPGMEVSNYEVYSMAKDIIMFSADLYYCILSRPSPGISIHYFKGAFKGESAILSIKKRKKIHTVKSIHFLLP